MKVYKNSRIIQITTLFSCLLCAYLLSLGSDLYSSDGQVMYKTSRTLVFEGTLALEPDPGLPQIRAGADDRWYSQYDPGLPLLVAPVVWVGDAWAKSQAWHRHGFAAYLILWILAVAAAGCGAVLFDVAHQIYATKTAIMIALAAGLCTPLWVYTRYFFAEAVLAFLLTLAFASAFRGRWWVAGFALGLAMLTRAAMTIYLIPLLWLYAHSPLRWGLGGLKFLFFPTLAGIGLLYHNWLRFGDPLTFGYGGQAFDTPPWVGIVGLLFSPAKSVFLYAPPLLVSVRYGRGFYRREPRLAQSLLLATGIALVFYGSWWAWDGGWCWGPRFLVPLIPLWLLPLGEANQPDPISPQAESQAERGVRHVAGLGLKLALLFGFLISGLGVITDVNTHYAHYADVVNYHPPILGAVRAVWEGETIPLRIFHLTELGWTQGSSIGFAAILCVGLVYSLSRLVWMTE